MVRPSASIPTGQDNRYVDPKESPNCLPPAVGPENQMVGRVTSLAISDVTLKTATKKIGFIRDRLCWDIFRCSFRLIRGWCPRFEFESTAGEDWRSSRTS